MSNLVQQLLSSAQATLQPVQQELDQQLQQLFVSLDTNGDGQISMTEFKANNPSHFAAMHYSRFYNLFTWPDNTTAIKHKHVH